jgi:hypothetical protein
MLTIRGYDTTSPSDIWFRPFANSEHDTKDYEQCSANFNLFYVGCPKPYHTQFGHITTLFMVFNLTYYLELHMAKVLHCRCKLLPSKDATVI